MSAISIVCLSWEMHIRFCKLPFMRGLALIPYLFFLHWQLVWWDMVPNYFIYKMVQQQWLNKAFLHLQADLRPSSALFSCHLSFHHLLYNLIEQLLYYILSISTCGGQLCVEFKLKTDWIPHLLTGTGLFYWAHNIATLSDTSTILLLMGT